MTRTTHGSIDDLVGGRPRPRAPWALVAVLALSGLIGCVLAGWEIDPGRIFSEPLMWLAAVAFFSFEVLRIDLPFRSQRHTYSMAEIPTIFGFFYLAPDELIVASLLGMAGEFFLVRRQQGLKLLFNLSLQFSMIVIELIVFEAIADSRVPTEATAMLACYVAVIVNAFLSHFAVHAVISFVEGLWSRALFWRGMWLGLATQLANASLGLIGVLLIEIDWLAILILATPIAVIYAAYWNMGKRLVTEERLRVSERRFSALIHASSDVTALIDAHGALQYVSEAATDLLGIDTTEVRGSRAAELFKAVPEAQQRFREALDRVLDDDEPMVFNLPAQHTDGSEVELEVRLTDLLADRGVEAVVMSARDITGRKRLEERLMQAQKMDAIGQLAGGIAHDFNNLLAVIQNYASFIRSDLPEESQSVEDADEILKATETASSLTRQLLSFARKEIVAPRVVDVNDLVTGMHKMLSRTIQESIELRTSLAPALPRVKVDRGRLEQVLINLAVNARAAMPGGGSLVISTSETEIAPPANGGAPAAQYVVVSMTDTGIGIPEHLHERIFEPFFTTKGKGQGTGLGLATVYGIVKQFDGHIEVESEENAGTTFRIYLPATAEESAEIVESDETDPSKARGTVLVAEDSEPVRRVVDRILSQASYEVLSAPSGVEAFRLWQKRSADIDLLVTDVIMPQMSGRELSELTGLTTVFISGYTDEIISQDLVSDGGHFLQKPFSGSQLLQIVAEAMATVSATKAE